MSGHGHQQRPLLFESCGRDDSAGPLGPMLHAHRGPLQRLSIQIFQTGKTAPRKKVRLHRPEAPLFSRLTVGMALFMAHKLKPVLAGKVRHLRHPHSVAARDLGPAPTRAPGGAPWSRKPPGLLLPPVSRASAPSTPDTPHRVAAASLPRCGSCPDGDRAAARLFASGWRAPCYD